MSAAHRSARWPALRLQAKRRDNFACVQCGKRGRLEVDHVIPVRKAPAKAFDLSNLQTLCGGPDGCHSKKTRHESGRDADPARQQWRELVRQTQPL